MFDGGLREIYINFGLKSKNQSSGKPNKKSLLVCRMLDISTHKFLNNRMIYENQSVNSILNQPKYAIFDEFTDTLIVNIDLWNLLK